MARALLIFVTLVEAIIIVGHAMVYATLSYLLYPSGNPSPVLLGIFAFLSIFFVCATLISMYFHTALSRFVYRMAAIWMGTLSLLVFASLAFWLLVDSAWLFNITIPERIMGALLFTGAVAASIWGVYRSFHSTTVRYSITLPHLPDSWHGRTAVMVSDVHFGPVRGEGTARKLAAQINDLTPDIVFLPGDLFDGPACNYTAISEGLKAIHAPLGVFFSEGNHEEFRDPGHYRQALTDAGIRILDREIVPVDGVQIAGLSFVNSTEKDILKEQLQKLSLDPTQPSILLKHAPTVPEIVADHGISLMLSGHTHMGQMWPYYYVVRRVFGPAGYGYSRYGNLQVITSSGYGTWGPPQRVGTQSEIVVIEFKKG